MSSWNKSFSRLVNGLSLVAKEIYNQSPELQRARNGDLEGLITSSGKKTLVAATDLVGLTSGKLRELSIRRSKENEPSVVYFDDEDNKDAVVVTPEIGSASIEPSEKIVDSRDLRSEFSDEVKNSNREGEIKVSGDEHSEIIGVRATESSAVASSSSEVVAPVKRRRPRERKVPSTPMARAYGYWNQSQSLVA